MKFSFVELSCRIQLDGTKLREIFLLILLVHICFLDNFHSFATLTCEIVVETNTRIMRSKISGNFVPSRITNDNTYNYITFLIYNAKISDNNAESGKVPRILAAFPR
jgi:hypothetical protein